MISLIFFAPLMSLAYSGLISHDLGGDDGHKATSYQNIQMEHFHAVPTYIKKEYKHLLEHPIPVGKSLSKVEVHHGGKHDHGYATVSAQNNAHGSGGHDDGGFGGASFADHDSGSLSGHQGASFADQGDTSHLVAQAVASGALGQSRGGYEVHDQNQELLQHQVAQAAQSHGALQYHAAAALSQAGASAGHGGASLGHYQAAAAGGHQDFEAAALQLQHGGFAGYGHSS